MFKPTDEQVNAVDLFSSGENLCIEAGAGTGKTSTLKLIADSTTKNGKYLAFNKAIVVESSEKMPKNIECKTAHSLAFGQIVGKNAKFRTRLSAPRQKMDEVVAILGNGGFDCSYSGGEKKIDPVRVAAIINNTVYNFCCSADLEVNRRHVPFVDGIDDADSWINNNMLANYVVPYAQKAWDDISQPTGRLQFKHESYLKLYQLSNPKINADFILFDEAQDANPVMLDIVTQQTDKQLIFVGDTNQQIYEFTGAVNAMENIEGANRTFLTKSFRFGTAIAEAANHILDMIGTDMRLVGFEQIDSRIGIVDRPNAVLVRTNAGAITNIIAELMKGKRVAYVGNVEEIIKFVRGCKDLQDGKRTMHPELMCFDSWDELCDYASMVDDKSLTLMIRLINQYTAGKIISSFAQLEKSEHSADIVISTAHKSKGREWNNVLIGGDFPEEMANVSPSEQRLMYVAITRAQQVLDVSAIDIFQSYYQGGE